MYFYVYVYVAVAVVPIPYKKISLRVKKIIIIGMVVYGMVV